MPYKTILVHLNNEPRVSRLVAASLQLACAENAHLTGLFVVPHVPFRSPILPSVAAGTVRRVLDAYRQSGLRIEQKFREAAGEAVIAEWRLHEPRSGGYVDGVLEHARTADLVVAAQKEADWDYGDMFDVPDWLALESGRPVLVVPKAGEVAPISDKVLVAWNNSRESARAVFDALPILRLAKEVRVLSVEEPGKPQTSGEEAGHGICETLRRHGVACIADHIRPSGGGEPGELLLSHAERRGCNLLVMGCYGKSRLREFILGGATRHVLKHATIPVLLAH